MKKRHRAATVFVDHCSGLGCVHLQMQLTSEETLEAKRAFEAYLNRCDVDIRHCHADNGRFADNLFIQDVERKQQTTSCCGANAHFQNGTAEKRIRDLQEQIRKQVLHAKARWPEAVELNFWPNGLRNTNEIRNNLPNHSDGTSPLQRFSDIDVAPKVKDCHAFGCPACALHSSLQSGGRTPKWNPRARLGINLGPSPRHAASVSLVLNLDTGLVSPQFHVQCDDFFETARPSAGNPTTFSQWQNLSGIGRKKPKKSAMIFAKEVCKRATEQREPLQALNAPQPEPAVQIDVTPDMPPELVLDPEPPMQEEQATEETPNVSRHCGVRRMTQKMRESQQQRQAGIVAHQSELPFDPVLEEQHTAMHEDSCRRQNEMDSPPSHMTKTDADTMYFDEAMRAPDAAEFTEACIKEVNDHVERKHWCMIRREDAPQGTNILPSVWSMKRKRDIKTQQVCKWKARLNVHGGKQEHAVNCFETHAPVVTWTTVRMLLNLSILNHWHARQTDFVLACPHADIEFDMHMELPKGIETKYGNGKTHVLKLLKNLCGQKQGGRVWNQFPVDGLAKVGFHQSTVDECLFFRDNVIFVAHVDDGVFASPDDKVTDKAISDIRGAGFDTEDQGDLKDYLGVNIEKLHDGRIKLTQPHLIKQILTTATLPENTPGRQTPAAAMKILQPDLAEPPFDERFHCRAMVGKLNFLEKSTRPDISYATHVIAKFSENPRTTHGEAALHLCECLRDTINDGLTLDPRKEESLVVCADADFSGNWHKRTAHLDVSTSKSRSGYVILFAGCPIIWSSKLQTQIALSTCEAECVSLSESLRSTIPIMSLIDEIRSHGHDVCSTRPQVHCKAFEDNAGALQLARLPKLRPRTKHLNLVLHHFRSHVTKGLISIYPISSDDQIADIFTKPLPQNIFLKHRKAPLGW